MTPPIHDPTVLDFCMEHDACTPGFHWATETGCKTMSQLWRHRELPNVWRIWIATRRGVCSDVDMRLFACWCATRIVQRDIRSRAAIIVATRFALGLATDAQMRDAHVAATPYNDVGYSAYCCTDDDASQAAFHASRHAAQHAAERARSSLTNTFGNNTTAIKAQAKQLVLMVGNPFRKTK